jgi:hypothetical protein
MQGDYEGAYAIAKLHLVDPAMTLPNRIELSLIVARCSSDKQDRYTHVSLTVACYSLLAEMIGC